MVRTTSRSSRPVFKRLNEGGNDNTTVVVACFQEADLAEHLKMFHNIGFIRLRWPREDARNREDDVVHSASIMAQGPGESSFAITVQLAHLGSGEEHVPQQVELPQVRTVPAVRYAVLNKQRRILVLNPSDKELRRRRKRCWKLVTALEPQPHARQALEKALTLAIHDIDQLAEKAPGKKKGPKKHNDLLQG